LKQISQADPSFRPDPQDPLGFGIISQLRLSHGISYGEAFFDLQPQYPCSALFLDPANALLLIPSDTNSSAFVRIGTAKFLRTDHQRRTMPLASFNPTRYNRVPYGPMTSEDGQSEVTIF
jgi:hypothetical protein